MPRPKYVAIIVGLILATSTGAYALAANADDPAATCDPSPTARRVPGGTEVTSVCVVPDPPPVTVTVTASPSPTPTVEPTPTPTPTQTVPPSPTPTPEPPTGFPDASNTGVPAGTMLPLCSPGFTVKAAQTVVLDRKLICGHVRVEKGGTLKFDNTKFDVEAYYAILNYGTVEGEDSDLVGGDTATIANYDSAKFTGRRLDVSGGEDGVRLANNSTLTDSYIHDLRGTSSSHYDSVTADGYRGWRIEHNTILNQHNQTAAVWVGDPRYSASEGVLTRNYLAGGGYTIYSGHGTGAGIDVTYNVFSRRYFPKVGYFGPVAKWESSGGINSFMGNTYDNGTPLN